MHSEKITSIRKIGIAKTVDIEVKTKEHIFYADGIVSQNSHAVGYGFMGYWSAYAKAHFPLHFFCAYLASARNKADFKEEVEELIGDTKQFDVEIKTPSVNLLNKNYSIIEGKIHAGIGNVKGIGESLTVKIINTIGEIEKQVGKKVKDFSWLETLLFIGSELTKTAFINLTAVGAFSHLGVYRKRMMFEYNNLAQLTGKYEVPWLKENIGQFTTIGEGVALLAETDSVTKGRKEKVRSLAKLLNDKTFTTIDDEDWIASVETELIGAPITCSKLDACNTSCGDTTCKEFNSREFTKPVNIACEVSRVSPYTTKDGKRMLYVTLRDSTGNTEAVVFSNSLDEVENLLTKGNTVCITGKKTNKGSLSVYKAIQI